MTGLRVGWLTEDWFDRVAWRSIGFEGILLRPLSWQHRRHGAPHCIVAILTMDYRTPCSTFTGAIRGRS